MVKGGRDDNQDQMRFAKLIHVVMGIARTGSRSDYAYQLALEKSNELKNLLETVPINATTMSSGGVGSEDVVAQHEEALAIVASPVS
jgi:hypothetical protein